MKNEFLILYNYDFFCEQSRLHGSQRELTDIDNPEISVNQVISQSDICHLVSDYYLTLLKMNSCSKSSLKKFSL